MSDDTRLDPKCPECGGALIYRGLPRCFACENTREDRIRWIQAAQRAADDTIPARYQAAHFDAPVLRGRVTDPAAIEAARTVAESDRSVVLTGGSGAGKTTLACCIARERAERGVRPVFAAALALARARAAAPLGEEPAIVRGAMRTPLLILDDLSADVASAHSAVVDVVHCRHDATLPMVVTTAFGLEAIAQKYGDGIARRIYEGSVFIACKGGR